MGKQTAIGFCILASLLLAGCGSSADQSSSTSTASAAEVDQSNKAVQYAEQIKSGTEHFSLQIVDASINKQVPNQLWVQVAPGHSQEELKQFGESVEMDYRDFTGLSRTDVMVCDDKPEVEVVNTNGNLKFLNP